VRRAPLEGRGCQVGRADCQTAFGLDGGGEPPVGQGRFTQPESGQPLAANEIGGGLAPGEAGAAGASGAGRPRPSRCGPGALDPGSPVRAPGGIQGGPAPAPKGPAGLQGDAGGEAPLLRPYTAQPGLAVQGNGGAQGGPAAVQAGPPGQQGG